jgi:excisionase family DNA binding protein
METQSIVVVPLSELNVILAETIKKIFSNCILERPQITTLQKETDYVTRKEAAKILSVSLVTLSKYTKQGKLTEYRLGHTLRYKRHEIESALENTCNAKHKRQKLRPKIH